MNREEKLSINVPSMREIIGKTSLRKEVYEIKKKNRREYLLWSSETPALRPIPP